MILAQRRLALAGCLLVVTLDAAQLVAGAGSPVGPAGGMAVYGLAAAGLAADRREAAWLLVVMPWVPLLALVAWTVGLSPIAPHAMMGVVALVQLLTGFAAAQALDLSPHTPFGD